MKKFLSSIFAAVICTAVFAVYGCDSDCSNGCGDKGAKTSYDIVCELDGSVLKGAERVEYYNDGENAVKELKFNLFGNAFRKNAKYSPIASQYFRNAYENGFSEGKTEIFAVKNEEENLNFKICGEDENILSVELSEEVFPNETTVVNVEFSLTLANVVARTGINGKTINLGNFYPILCAKDENGFYECEYYSSGDPFFSECADYTVCLTYADNLVAATSGEAIKSETADGKTTVTYQIKSARSFAAVLCENFECITDDSTGVRVNYYYYEDDKPMESLAYAVKSIKTYEKLFGKYAYPAFSVAQTRFLQGGMEYPAMVMISDALEEKAYGEVIAHETAHQWWQTAVGNNEVEYGFLDEGLAEYSVVLFYENNSEYGFTRDKLVKSSEQTYKIYCSVYDKLFKNVNTVMIRPLKDFTSEYEYVNIAYVKACIMYDCLRKTLGEEKFFAGLTNYYEDYKFKNATPYDLAGSFEKVGADATGFLEGFWNGKAVI